MNVTFHPEATQELTEAALYYEGRQLGLGVQFSEEADATIGRIRRYPEAWPKASAMARCCKMNRFPYGIVYRLKPGVIRIYAVAHLNRMPGYWRSRLGDEE